MVILTFASKFYKILENSSSHSILLYMVLIHNPVSIPVLRHCIRLNTSSCIATLIFTCIMFSFRLTWLISVIYNVIYNNLTWDLLMYFLVDVFSIDTIVTRGCLLKNIVIAVPLHFP